ncbi:MAG TPA: hypothetical protein PLB55_13640 [Prosthecobacter sp.]|nr:hypothetical protein [Prosthecobacter sp.]
MFCRSKHIYRAAGQTKEMISSGESRRGMSRMSSKELWTEWNVRPQTILMPDERDAELGYYYFMAMPVHRHAGIWWGHLAPFLWNDLYASEIAWSRDGWDFQRLPKREQFIVLGPEGAWDHSESCHMQQHPCCGVSSSMKTLGNIARLLALMAVMAGTFGRADDKVKPPPANPAEVAKNAPAKAPPVKPPTEAELRAVITKGLGFLAKEGDEWMTAKNCNSCHHMPELLWSHREAKRRGFAVDPKKFDEWLEWSVERATDKKPGLEEAALMILAMPERPAPELTKLLAAEQKPDGSWSPAGQFSGMQKRGAPDAQASSTRLNLIALATLKEAAPQSDAAHAKAATMLQKKDAPTSMESLVFRTLFARRLGKPEEATALIQDIVKRQRNDGGWSSFLGENMSDVLATGQVLHALQPAAADPAVANAIARAQHWLLQTQREDGSWPIDITHISKQDRSGPAKAKSFKDATDIYIYWGSGWATIGLLQGVPVK